MSRIAATCAFQILFWLVAFVGLRWSGGNYDDMPWVKLFICFGLANFGFEVVLDKFRHGYFRWNGKEILPDIDLLTNKKGFCIAVHFQI